jgi:hypothetical protein
MLPFASYPGGGREPLGQWKGSNARREYGLAFMRLTGQRRCAYCDVDLASTYEGWLTLVLDHAIPVSVCKQAGMNWEWYWDFSNAVLACAACNGFCNRYQPSFTVSLPATREAFYDLRDRIFEERKARIAHRHAEERRFFQRTPSNADLGPTG